MKNIFLYGATSAIAQDILRIYAKKNCNLFLVARNQTKLDSVVADLQTRSNSIKVVTYISEATDYDSHAVAINSAYEAFGTIDAFIIAHGSLPDQENIKNDQVNTLKEFELNATSYISLCTLIAAKLEDKGSGKLAVISSVAGERGRKALYTYSAAKSAVTEFMSGLRQRFAANENINIITIKPGIIETPMTAHLPKSGLMASSEKAAQLIYKAIESGTEVAFVPGFWKPIMSIIKHIPEKIFKKLNF